MIEHKHVRKEDLYTTFYNRTGIAFDLMGFSCHPLSRFNLITYQAMQAAIITSQIINPMRTIGFYRKQRELIHRDLIADSILFDAIRKVDHAKKLLGLMKLPRKMYLDGEDNQPLLMVCGNGSLYGLWNGPTQISDNANSDDTRKMAFVIDMVRVIGASNHDIYTSMFPLAAISSDGAIHYPQYQYPLQTDKISHPEFVTLPINC